MILREKLGKLLLGDDINSIQKILLSIGHICFKETSSACLNVALDLIFHLCRCKVNLVYPYKLFFVHSTNKDCDVVLCINL